jgi:hypothetical protein
MPQFQKGALQKVARCVLYIVKINSRGERVMLKTNRRNGGDSTDLAAVGFAAIALIFCLSLLLVGEPQAGWRVIGAGAVGVVLLAYEAQHNDSSR